MNMAIIRKKKIGNMEYYYLEHSFREGTKVMKKEIYLGKVLPKDIEGIKKQFIRNIYKDRWFPLFSRIKEGFLDEQKRMPISAIKKNKETFAVRFTYDTNRIEGSTLTLRETADLLEKGISPSEKPLRDVKEAEAHINTFYEMLGNKKDISIETVLYFHKKLFENTKKDIAGKIRDYQEAGSFRRSLQKCI